MTEQCDSQETRLAGLFKKPWPPCAKEVIADGKPWKIVKVYGAPDNIAVGSTVTFSNNCTVENHDDSISPKLDMQFCCEAARSRSDTATAWSSMNLKHCKEYNALTGKVNISDSDGVVHPHTVTIRVSGAKALGCDKPVIVCEYNDDVWNGPGSWEAIR